MNSNLDITSRKKTRKFLFQKLYAQTFSPVTDENFEESFYDGVFDFTLDQDYLDEMFTLVLKNEQKLLYLIHYLAPKFKLDSMNMAFIIPICIWACEMLYLEEEIPAKVSINEAVEIAKVYWDDSCKKLVNGTMNKLYKDFDSCKILLQESWNIIEKSIFCK